MWVSGAVTFVTCMKVSGVKTVPFPSARLELTVTVSTHLLNVRMNVLVESRGSCDKKLKTGLDLSLWSANLDACREGGMTSLVFSILLLLQTASPAAGVRVAVSYTHLRAHETPEHLVC